MSNEPVFSGIRTFMKLPYISKSAIYSAPDVFISGVPYDLGTSGRPGARFGPAGVRDASQMLYSEDNPNFKLNPLKKLQIFDAGDMEVSMDPKKAMKLIENQALELTKNGSQLVSIGGDHSIALPLLKAAKKRHGKVCLVHFDAHTDTWQHDRGTPHLHGTVFHRAAKSKLIDTEHSVQIGVRSPIDNEIMNYTQKDLGFHVITANMVHMTDLMHVVNGIKRTVGDRKVYLTFDIDCIDPSQAPGTGTPEIGGLFTWQALHIMKSIKDLNWVGMDMVEVAPAYDHAEITSLAAATFVWTYLSMLASKRK